MIPKLSAGLSRYLAEVMQRVDLAGRQEMTSALDDIARNVSGDPIDSLDDERVPDKARKAIKQLIVIAFQQQVA